MSLHQPNRNHSNSTSDPFFELLGDEPTVEPAATYRSALRDTLMSFPPLAGLITFRLPVIGRVFFPRLVGTLGIVAIGAGMSAFVALWPFESADDTESVSVSERAAIVLEAESVAPLPPALLGRDLAAESDEARTRGEALRSFDPPRSPVRLSVQPPVEAAAPSTDPEAAEALIAVVQPTRAAAAPPQAPPPRDEGSRGRPVAPITPVPTATETVVQTGGDVVELPPTATARPTSEGRPTLPPAFPTETPPTTETPEPIPTPAP